MNEVFAQIVQLALAGGLGIPYIIGLIIALAIIATIAKKIGMLEFKLPPPSPDLVENPPSPPIILNPDGTIPTNNPVIPPDPTVM